MDAVVSQNGESYNIIISLGKVSKDYAESCRLGIQSYLDILNELELDDG